ncbi:MAG: superoxide dismutase [Calditrichaeota bacterium]|nr:superoxide dismutase [Calditrichota bacterium]MCB9369484.1 superoxide dismutase [Calditrichota bacterium]
MAFSAKDFGPKILELDGISKKTVEEHLKLYNGYVNKTNEVLEKLAAHDGSGANQVYSEIRGLKVDLSFAIAGMQNHEVYFSHLTPGGSALSGDLKKQIEKDFGSFDKYIADLKASGMAARGWVWLVWWEDGKRLLNWVGDAQNSHLSWNMKPIMAMDVYEHAYFIDYGAARPGYIDAFIKNLCWETVGKHYDAARK